MAVTMELEFTLHTEIEALKKVEYVEKTVTFKGGVKIDVLREEFRGRVVCVGCRHEMCVYECVARIKKTGRVAWFIRRLDAKEVVREKGRGF